MSVHEIGLNGIIQHAMYSYQSFLILSVLYELITINEKYITFNSYFAQKLVQWVAILLL